MPKDEFCKCLLVTFQLVPWNVAEIEAGSEIVRFVDQGLRVSDLLLQVNPHEKALPPFLDFIKERMEHDPNPAEGYSGITNDYCTEVVEEIRVYCMLLVAAQFLE